MVPLQHLFVNTKNANEKSMFFKVLTGRYRIPGVAFRNTVCALVAVQKLPVPVMHSFAARAG
jgi:hypothetical protein